MKRFVSLVGSSISKAIPIIGIGSDIKENLVAEIKAAAACVFFFGFSACLICTGLVLLLIYPSAPGYGISLMILAAAICWPSWIRLQTARSRIDALKPLIESAQKVSQLATTAINTVSSKTEVAVNAIKNVFERFRKSEQNTN